MVNLTRIYTRTGDTGTTALGDMSRTPKTDPRIAATRTPTRPTPRSAWLSPSGAAHDDRHRCSARVQNDLFDVGADLATPVVENPEFPPPRVEQTTSTTSRRTATRYLEELEKLRSFILPGGTPGAALLHQACTVVRRAERSTWAALERARRAMNPLTATYVNRLSDLLFIPARSANKEVGDVLWVPGENR